MPGSRVVDWKAQAAAAPVHGDVVELRVLGLRRPCGDGGVLLSGPSARGLCSRWSVRLAPHAVAAGAERSTARFGGLRVAAVVLRGRWQVQPDGGAVVVSGAPDGSGRHRLARLGPVAVLEASGPVSLQVRVLVVERARKAEPIDALLAEHSLSTDGTSCRCGHQFAAPGLEVWCPALVAAVRWSGDWWLGGAA